MKDFKKNQELKNIKNVNGLLKITKSKLNCIKGGETIDTAELDNSDRIKINYTGTEVVIIDNF